MPQRFTLAVVEKTGSARRTKALRSVQFATQNGGRAQSSAPRHCATHLHGGEDAMLKGMVERLVASGIAARAAIADSWGAAGLSRCLCCTKSGTSARILHRI